MKKFLTLDDVNVKSKVVGIRIDINSAIVDGKIECSERLLAHARTIKELVRKKAKVVVLAHQGRLGGKDYRELDEHLVFLAKELKQKINYVDEVYGQKVVGAVHALKPGDVLVLRNIRAVAEEAQEKSPEEHAKSSIVAGLEPLFDFYVQDAFSTIHRSHASMVGFYGIPNIAGRVVEKELRALEKIEHPKRPFVFVIGGIKTDDVLELVEDMQGVDTFLVAGSVGELGLIAHGVNIGKKAQLLEKQGDFMYLPRIKRLLERKDIVWMQDGAVNKKGKRMNVDFVKDEKIVKQEMVKDIGDVTIKSFSMIIKKAKTVYMKGPVGAYEEKPLQKGTKALLEAITHTRAFSLAGGGNTVSAMKMLVPRKKFSHVSLGGGALLAFLLKKKMPALEILKAWKKNGIRKR